MSKRHSAKYKIDRRMGENLWGRPKSPVNDRQYGPGQHGQRRKSKVSDFGLQLRAKQKLKGYYANLTEKQFRRTYDEAARRKGNTSELLIGLLESRLDAIVYRSKFVPTPFAARQFVNHGHVKVNGRRVNIPSFLVKPGDLIDLRGLDANSATSSMDAFDFVGAASGRRTGQLSFSSYGNINAAESALGIDLDGISGKGADGPVTIVFGNTDSDADYEFALVLLGVRGLDASDFLLV